MRKHFPNTCFRRRSALTVLATIALADIAKCDDVPIDVNGAWGNAVVCGLCKNVVGQWEAHLAGASPDEVQAGFRMEKGNRRILAHDELAVVEVRLASCALPCVLQTLQTSALSCILISPLCYAFRTHTHTIRLPE